MNSATAKRTALAVVETTFNEVLHGAAKVWFMAVVTREQIVSTTSPDPDAKIESWKEDGAGPFPS